MAVLLTVAIAAPARAYEVKRTSNGATVHWEVARLDVYVGLGLVTGSSALEGQRATRLAASAWNGLGAPNLVVVDQPAAGSYRPGQPGVQIVVLDPWPHTQGLLATTMTLYDDATGRLVDADVLVNPSARLAYLSGDGGGDPRWDLQALLTHELGHVLGLAESRDDRMATMWPTLRAGETHQRSLRGDDRQGIDAIYAGRSLAGPAGCSRASVSGDRAGAPWPVALLALLLGLAGMLRRRRPAQTALIVAALLFLWIPSATAGPSSQGSTDQRADDADRWAPFAGESVLGTATLEPARVGDDGFHRTRVHVGPHGFDVLGGCVDGLCQRFGETQIPVDGEEVLLAPATGAWTHVRGVSAFGGWLGAGPALPLSRDPI